MVDILNAAPGIVGAGGAGGLLLVLVLYLVKANRDDRTQHRETVAALTKEHRDENADLEQKIDRLEARIDDLQRLVDDERGLRRDAEDRAARAESQLAVLQRVTGAAHAPATTRLPPPQHLANGEATNPYLEARGDQPGAGRGSAPRGPRPHQEP